MWFDEELTSYHEGFEIRGTGFSVVTKIQEGIVHMIDFGDVDVIPIEREMSRSFVDELISSFPKTVTKALPRYRGKNADLV
ncbi:hypothetical protein ACGTN6_21000, partial [Halomonas sp. THAF12]|uniref:hypothetical protein n=1 Tax=Halomonas sp. B23F22_10 TaxID=3459515 RepID=UPI00373F5ACD